MKILALILFISLLSCLHTEAQTAKGNGPGISCDSTAIASWATSCKVTRGPKQAGKPELGYSESGSDVAATGKADNVTVSLGDGGSAVLAFGRIIKNIPGADFAVYENSFDGKFLELAFVEVSSDSLRWVRFPSRSLTGFDNQVGTFGNINSDDLRNFAGQHIALKGTPFDLSELKDSAGIDLNGVRFVRVVDVIGCITQPYCSRDAEGRKVNDPWPTPFPQGGFDLDGVAILKNPYTGIEDNRVDDDILCYPNPASEVVNIRTNSTGGFSYSLVSISGARILGSNSSGPETSLETGAIKPGTYFLIINSNRKIKPVKLIIN